MLLTTALYCLLLTLTWVCTHTCTHVHAHTHTHTHTQGSRLCARRFTLAIAPDDWIKGDDFFLLLFCLSGLCAMTTNSS